MSDQPSAYPRPAYAWYMVFLLLAIYTFSFIDRQILGLLGPSIKADFKISDTEFGVLTGYAFAIFYTVFGLFCARIADSKSRRGLITVGLIVWSIMTALGAFARDFIHLFLLRIGVGAGEATLAPAAGSLLADSFPKHRLATALSVYSMGIPVGSALAFIVGGWVIQIAGQLPDWTVPGLGTIGHWQKAFILVGLPGILLALLIGTIKEPSRKGMVGSAKAVPVSAVARHMLSHFRAYAGICFGISAVAMLGFGTLMFLALFFSRFHGLGPAEVGKTFGTIALITGPMGLLIGGTIADRLFRKGYKDAHIRTLIISPLGFAVPAMTLPFIQDTHVVWMVLVVSNLFLNLPSGVAFAGLHIITPNQMRGQVTAFYVLCTNIIGYGSGPWLIGFFTDHVFGDEMKLNYAMALVAAITTPLCLGLLLWGRKAFAKAVVAEEERLAAEQQPQT